MKDIKYKFLDLIDEVQTLMSEVEEAEKTKLAIENDERRVRELEASIHKENIALEGKKGALKENEKYIELRFRELNAKEASIDIKKQELVTIAMEREALEKRREEVKQQEQITLSKIRELDKLTEQENELKRREKLVDDARIVDLERKKSLDIRETKIRDKEETLQRTLKRLEAKGIVV